MKKNILALALMLFFVSTNANAWTGNVNAFLGQKTLEEDDWHGESLLNNLVIQVI